MTKKVAEELIAKTPKAARKKFAHQLAKKRRQENPSKMWQRLKRLAGHGSSTWITYKSTGNEAEAQRIAGHLESAGVRHVKVAKQSGGLFGSKERVTYEVQVLREGVRAMGRREAEAKKPKGERKQSVSYRGHTITGSDGEWRTMGESFPSLEDAKIYIAATGSRKNPKKPSGSGTRGYELRIGARTSRFNTFDEAYREGVNAERTGMHAEFSIVDIASGHGVKYTRSGAAKNPKKGPIGKSTQLVTQAVGAAYAPIWKALDFVDSATVKAAGKIGKAINKRRRKNPEGEAAEMYSKFHGLPSQEVIQVREKEHYHKHLTALGICCGVIVAPVTGGDKAAIGLSGYVWDVRAKEFVLRGAHKDIVHLCTSEDGHQMFLVGAPIDIDCKALGITGKMADKELIDLGECLQVWYETTKKWENGKVETAPYYHKLSEESHGPRPELIWDRRNKTAMFAGGSYYIPKPLLGVSQGITD